MTNSRQRTAPETPEQKKAREADSKLRSERRREAAETSRVSKVRKAVYNEMGYPPDGDPKAEAEIERRLGGPLNAVAAMKE